MGTARKKKGVRPASQTVRVFVVDDHAVVRHGLTQRINLEPDMQICGEANTAHDAFEQIRTVSPDVALIDISLDGGNGLDLIKDLSARGERIRILVVSGHDEDVYAERCIRAGAHGYINKTQAIDKIVEAIRCVLAGEYYLSSAVASRALRRLAFGRAEVSPSPVEGLSDRELQVFDLLGRGLTVNQIAEKLFLSPKTIETYRAHLKEKLNVRNSAELTRQAIQWVLTRD